MKLPKVEWNRVLNWRVFPWVLAAVLLATTLTNYWLLRGEKREDARVEDVRGVANEFLLALTNFSAKTIDQDVARIKSFAIGQFAGEVAQTFSADRIRQIKTSKVVSKSTVRSVFVEDASDESASVFGVVDESVTNSGSPAPRTDVLRVELVMIDTTKGWKINQVNILQNPGGTVPGGTA